jgi:glutathione S-transferase
MPTPPVLYDLPASGNCYKVRLLLAQLGIPYERRELNAAERSNREGLLGELNPALRVPTLVLEDGRPLAESGAILWYFADGTGYLPAEPFDRAKVLQWMFFEQYTHEPYVAVARYWLHTLGSADPDALAEKHRLGYVALDALERGLTGRDFLVGGRYSIADIALYAYTHVADEGGFDLDGYPVIRAWLDRVAAQAGHVRIDE